MANYFKHFNKTFYVTGENSTSVDALTNLTTRISFVQKYIDNAALYYLYNIQDGETPEVLAYKLYNSTEKHWVILMFNNIMDPQYEWPLDQRSLGLYIEDKYSASQYADTANTSNSGLSWAQSHTKDYIITETTLIVGTNESYSNTYLVDSATYANTTTTSSNFTLENGDVIRIDTDKQEISYFDYEVNLNDDKRAIKILKPEFVEPVFKEFKSLVK